LLHLWNCTLCLRDALPIWPRTRHGLEVRAALLDRGLQPRRIVGVVGGPALARRAVGRGYGGAGHFEVLGAFEVARRHAERARGRSEEHTSELQSRENLVCR